MRGAWIVICSLLVLPALAVAQTRPSTHGAGDDAGRLEIGGSIGAAFSHHLETERATENGNGVPNGSPVTLFETATSFERGTVLEGRIGWRLTRTLVAEGTFAMTRTHLRTEIRNDFEQAAPVAVRSPITQYTMEGGLLWQPARLRFGHDRARLFASGGGGYLRQLHDGATLAQTGGSIYAGGGLKYRIYETTRPAILKSLGIRADVRANVIRGGFDVTEKTWHAYASTSAGLFVCF